MPKRTKVVACPAPQTAPSTDDLVILSLMPRLREPSFLDAACVPTAAT